VGQGNDVTRVLLETVHPGNSKDNAWIRQILGSGKLEFKVIHVDHGLNLGGKKVNKEKFPKPRSHIINIEQSGNWS
jgi:hypothetical protein